MSTRPRHRALVLDLLRAAGPLSKATLARELDLSVPTVSEILNDFKAEGVVEAVGQGQSSGGRRPVLYGLRMDGLLAIGVAIDHLQLTAVISDLSG